MTNITMPTRAAIWPMIGITFATPSRVTVQPTMLAVIAANSMTPATVARMSNAMRPLSSVSHSLAICTTMAITQMRTTTAPRHLTINANLAKYFENLPVLATFCAMCAEPSSAMNSTHISWSLCRPVKATRVNNSSVVSSPTTSLQDLKSSESRVLPTKAYHSVSTAESASSKLPFSMSSMGLSHHRLVASPNILAALRVW
mmetsp:Transcript_1120/g.3329  ORF Transcript_1120/g.3329 Transcript_1120/m.3329 type:complete len:201 (-) Transcript_1120:1756-2358(-)